MGWALCVWKTKKKNIGEWMDGREIEQEIEEKKNTPPEYKNKIKTDAGKDWEDTERHGKSRKKVEEKGDTE